MKAKTLIKIVLLLISILLCVAALNLPVTTKQGVNYVVSTKRMPLYFKVLGFFYRHFAYQQLIKEITKDAKSDRGKILAIFKWTYKNIKQRPEGWPVIDDHVWHIVIRGYGENDQAADVFATLCNYAGVDAFYSWVYTRDRKQRIPLSFARIDSKWVVFDPFHGIYFKVEKDKLADVEAIRSGSGWTIEAQDEKPTIDYAIYFDNLPPVKEIELKKANTQSPLNRLLSEITK